MPISRKWVDSEVKQLKGEDREIAKLVLVVAKASYQFDESLVRAVQDVIDEKRLIRILAYTAYSAAKRLAQLAGERVRPMTHRHLPRTAVRTHE